MIDVIKRGKFNEKTFVILIWDIKISFFLLFLKEIKNYVHNSGLKNKQIIFFALNNIFI